MGQTTMEFGRRQRFASIVQLGTAAWPGQAFECSSSTLYRTQRQRIGVLFFPILYAQNRDRNRRLHAPFVGQKNLKNNPERNAAMRLCRLVRQPPRMIVQCAVPRRLERWRLRVAAIGAPLKDAPMAMEGLSRTDLL